MNIIIKGEGEPLTVDQRSLLGPFHECYITTFSGDLPGSQRLCDGVLAIAVAFQTNAPANFILNQNPRGDVTGIDLWQEKGTDLHQTGFWNELEAKSRPRTSSLSSRFS